MRSTDRRDAAKGTDGSDPARGIGDGIVEGVRRGRRTTAARGAEAGDGTPELMERVLRRENVRAGIGGWCATGVRRASTA